MRIPFTKAHGAKNDFLLTWAIDAPKKDLAAAAVAICDRRTGVGADGWLLVSPAPKGPRECDGTIRVLNSDGSEAEISGNGTRCAAAFLVDVGQADTGARVRICTGAGIKELKLIERRGLCFRFEMNMGRPEFPEGDRIRLELAAGAREATVIDVGNPQCALVVDQFNFDCRALGAEIERHPRFPRRTNVSFVRPVDRHSIEVRFFERGAGETMSSGTGAAGAAAAALRLGLVESPVTVLTPAGPLEVRAEGEIFLTGPAQIVAGGEFYLGE